MNMMEIMMAAGNVARFKKFTKIGSIISAVWAIAVLVFLLELSNSGAMTIAAYTSLITSTIYFIVNLTMFLAMIIPAQRHSKMMKFVEMFVESKFMTRFKPTGKAEGRFDHNKINRYLGRKLLPDGDFTITQIIHPLIKQAQKHNHLQEDPKLVEGYKKYGKYVEEET